MGTAAVTRALGIDPGLDGGLVVLAGSKLLAHIAMPTIREGKRRHLDLSALLRLLAAMPWYGATAYLEAQGPRPHQHVVATATQMLGYGQLIGLLAARAHPIVRVQPAVWKRWAGLIGQPKERSVVVANERWPELALKRTQHGLADAALIAAWGVSHG